MNTYLARVNNYYDNYYNYQTKNKQNEQAEEPVCCESIFIYTCEPKENNQTSFKGANSNILKISFLPLVAATGAAIASLFNKKRDIVRSEDDIKQIIQNQKDMEYICALKRDFIPHSEFDMTVLGNYNKNIEMLEQENKAIIGKIVDSILSDKKFKDLPGDYPNRIKDRAYCLSTWAGSAFTLDEKDVEYHISKLKEYDAEEKERIIQLNTEKEISSSEPKQEYSSIEIKSKDENTLPVPIFVEILSKENQEPSDVMKILTKVEKGDFSYDEAINEILKLLENINIEPDWNLQSDSVNEGIIDIIE